MHNAKISKKYYDDSKKIFALYKLVNLFFWKNKISIAIMLIFPLFFTIFLYLIGHNNSEPKYIWFGQDNIFIIAISAIPISLFSMPLLIIEMKNSILLIQIFEQKIKKITYLFVVWSFFFFVSLLSVLFGEICWLIFMNNEIGDIFNINDGFEIFFSFLTLLITTTSLGLLIGTLLRYVSTVQMLGISILLLTFLLSGIFSATLTSNVLVIKYINLFSPLNYPLILINQTFFAHTYISSTWNIFNLKQDFILSIDKLYLNSSVPPNDKELLKKFLEPYETQKIVWYYTWQKALALIMPFFISLSFFHISLIAFKWYKKN